MKRNEKVVEAIKAIVNDATLDVTIKKTVGELLRRYEDATYEKESDRHEFYASMVSRMVNDYGFDDDGLAEKMSHDHPTLQQNFMRFVVKFIRKMAEKPHWDGRNEASVLLAKEIVKVLDEKGSYLPMI